uniref:Uncharacterized protein n=1 Tax=Moschus moschiferus TaxID=68415 RepID=A0A8C6FIJ1_MOSMO
MADSKFGQDIYNKSGASCSAGNIMYNMPFLVLVIVASFFILKNFNPTVNYILSISASSGLIALLSTGSK